jgi:2-methylcitrate dehydratase PrpD
MNGVLPLTWTDVVEAAFAGTAVADPIDADDRHLSARPLS